MPGLRTHTARRTGGMQYFNSPEKPHEGVAKKMKLDDEKFAVAVVDFKAANAAKKLTDSLKNTGFAVLTNSPVAEELK